MTFAAGQRVLASDLNTATQQNAWDTTFVPSWTQSGGSPAIGNGTIVTGFTHVSRVVSGRYQYVFGSTTNFGTGAAGWTFTLPVTPNPPAISSFFSIGTWTGNPAGTTFCGTMRIGSAGTVTLVPNNSTQLVHTTNPGVWASTNYLLMSFEFEAAS